ncbi:TonB-dependent receptor [Flavihumibacter sp. RY-1]|uniref:TonB-dependent receptor n=1 Tax=Flavihumibacter fluminis TaxID=2909236 RepID=A0ABS9BDS2_9BACT|nr:TonB-dependent receptor [Flavihumibacter fluminis]MCF1713750.1 TonB-dependent receptor [Flavihumibacter fluminis]
MKKITGILVFLFGLAISASAQQKISGTVSSGKDGTPIAGASVMIKGSSTGTVTENDGTYTINIPAGTKTLVFSAVGMKTIERSVGNSITVDVVLEPTGSSFDEVVVIGYANARKQDLQGAVSTVKVTDNFKGRPASLGNIIQGQMPGVNVTQSGDPTSSGSISIRGKGNKNGDAVLIVVDGVPGAPYNPADIETITVLKDASSAAIYGAFAGSGGVVLITTKQAKAGKMTIEANVWNGTQQAWRTPKVLTAEQFNMVWKDASTAAGRTVPKTYDPITFPYGNVTRTDWVDEIFRTGRMQHYDLTIRGGTNTIKALASVSYDDVQGTLINTYNKKLTTRLNVDFNLAKWIEIGQHVLYDFNKGQSAIGDGHTGTIFGAMAYPRFSTVREFGPDGELLYGGTVPRWALAEGFSVEADLRNPVAMLEKVKHNNPANKIFSKTSLRLKPLPGLQFRSEFSADVTSFRNESFQMRFLEPGRTINQNYRSISNTLASGWNWDNILSYNKTFNNVHDVAAMGGFLMNKRTSRYNWAEVRGYAFEDPYQTIFNNGTDWSIRPSEDIWEETFVSVLGRVSYSFDNRYFVSGSVRRDASSKLSPTNNSDVFPAVSASWKISSENFMQRFQQINLLKIRASWGQVGNIASVRRFIYAPPYQVTSWPLFLGPNGEGQAFGIFQPTIPNPNLKWERTEQINIGLDLSLFDNSLTATVDYFSKKTKDLIESMPTPSVAGVASPPEFNIGQVENKGWEFTLNYNRKIGSVDFNIGGNLGTFDNKVISIGQTAFIAHGNGVNSMNPLRSTAGMPWHSFFLIDAVGIFRNQKDIDDYTWTDPVSGTTKKIQPNARPGDLQFRDVNNDGTINDGDRVYMGAYDMPDFSYGFNLGANWKGFSLSLFMQGISGVNVFNGVKAMTYTGSKGWNMSTDVLNSYNYNPNSDIPNLAVVEDPNGNFSKVSDYFLDKADYLRLKNLHLAYTLPSSLMQQVLALKDARVRVYANAENLITITKYKGFDPEVGNLGIDGGRFPVSRMFSVGMNVSF